MEANIINDNFVHDSNYKRIYIKQNMDYEEKYKKTLEKARKELQACGSLDCDAARQIFRFFPELKENEDEKMLREIKRYIKEQGNKPTGLPNGTAAVADMLAWLEKQGKQKLYTDFSSLRTWKYIVDAVWTEKEGIGQYLDSPFTEEVAKKLQKRFGNIEPKPSWSEEDEKRISSILLSIEYCKEQYPDLREYQYDIDWLKSLRPQKQWKPSEEQMDALRYVTNFDYGGYKAILVSLYEQLKKLREE